jgi:hypothetical protein
MLLAGVCVRSRNVLVRFAALLVGGPSMFLSLGVTPCS